MNTLKNISLPAFTFFILSFLVLTACSPTSPGVEQPPNPTSTGSVDTGNQDLAGQDNQNPAPTNSRVEDQNDYSYPQLLPFDAIRPIYEPRFRSADQSPLNEEELIIGVAIDGEAKAYPITVLRIREMVNDELADWPILVTW